MSETEQRRSLLVDPYFALKPPEPSEPAAAGIGDIASIAKGSGARYNTGKPPLDLVPLVLIAAFHRPHRRRGEERVAVEALDALGRFQSQTGGAMAVLHELGDGWAECAQVFEYGRRKYAAWNWAKGMPWSAVISSAARHLLAMIDGEVLDAESGLPHRGHVFCNIVMLLAYEETFATGDDRPAEGLLTPVQE